MNSGVLFFTEYYLMKYIIKCMMYVPESFVYRELSFGAFRITSNCSNIFLGLNLESHIIGEILYLRC